MTCADVDSLASDYLDRRLDSARLSLLEDHLRGCAGCRREIEELRAAIRLVGAVEPIRAAPDFLLRVNKKIDAATKKRLLHRLFSPPKIKVPLEIAALLLLSTLALHFYWESPQTPGSHPPPSAAKSADEAPSKAPRPETFAPRAPRREFKAESSELQAEPDAEALRQGLPPQIPGSLAQDVKVPDPARYENAVRDLLQRHDGVLLARTAEADSGVLLTIAVPQSRQAEFLSALREQTAPLARRRERALSAPAGRAGRSLPEESEPKVILSVRIAPEK